MGGRRQEHRGEGTGIKVRQGHGDNKTGGKEMRAKAQGQRQRSMEKGAGERARVRGYRGKGTCIKGIGVKTQEQGYIQGQRHRSKGVRV